jgi:hypothetical protein
MHIIVDDDQMPDTPFRVRLDLHLNSNHFLPPLDHARFVIKPDFNLHSLFEIMSIESGVETPIQRTSISKLASVGIGNRAQKKVEAYFNEAMTTMDAQAPNLDEVMESFSDNSSLLDGINWAAVINGIKHPFTLTSFAPVISFIKSRIKKEEELIALLKPVFKEDTRKVEFLQVKGWPALLDFQRKNTLKKEQHIAFPEIDHSQLSEQEQVVSAIKAMLHDVGDFYFSLFANLDVALNQMLPSESDHNVKAKMQSSLEPLIAVFVEQEASRPFIAIFIEHLRGRIEKLSDQSLTINQMAVAIPLDLTKPYTGGETLVERKKNILNKWRRGDDNPSPEALQLFMQRLGCLAQGQCLPEALDDIHIADELLIQVIWSLNRLFNLMMSTPHPESVAESYLTMEVRKAILCDLLQHYQAHWDYWSDHFSESTADAEK